MWYVAHLVMVGGKVVGLQANQFGTEQEARSNLSQRLSARKDREQDLWPSSGGFGWTPLKVYSHAGLLSEAERVRAIIVARTREEVAKLTADGFTGSGSRAGDQMLTEAHLRIAEWEASTPEAIVTAAIV